LRPYVFDFRLVLFHRQGGRNGDISWRRFFSRRRRRFFAARTKMNVTELQKIMLAIVDVRPVAETLRLIAGALADQPGVLLARIWLNQPGDLCDRCALRTFCPSQERCLHLAASRAAAELPNRPNLEDLNGPFRRFPLGLRVIGRVGASGESAWLREINGAAQWLARNVGDFGARDDEATPSVFRDDVAGVQSFIGHPLIFRHETLGVLGVFGDRRLNEDHFQWLRTFADHAAVAIHNARTFEEIRRLHQRLELENSFLRNEVNERDPDQDIVGTSSAFHLVLDRAKLVAQTDATVLLTGESGTGKSVLAKFIHNHSQRAKGNFVHVNCGSITPQLFESEFFGHVRGAFTGAVRDRIGRFQFADEGTLFLDEVAEIPLDLQSKLLKVVQTGVFERVGDDASRKVNVRLIAASNKSLPDLVRRGAFREDLFFRLSVFPLDLPPLRERRDDIAPLARRFLAQMCRRLKRPVPELSAERIAFLQRREWSGNIRELENFIERAVIISPPGRLVFEDPPPSAAPFRAPTDAPSPGLLTAADLKRIEAENLQALLTATKGKIYGPDGAARRFGVPPTTLISRLKALGIKPKT
jgi:transcriptional regulator with GAF, ATPase, and Fis domain